MNRGKRWHEMAENEGLTREFLAFSAAIVGILVAIALLGCSPAYGEDLVSANLPENEADISQGGEFSAVSDLISEELVRQEKAEKILSKMDILFEKGSKSCKISSKLSNKEDFKKAKVHLNKAKRYLKLIKKYKAKVIQTKAGKEYNRKAWKIVKRLSKKIEASKDVYDDAKTRKKMNEYYASNAASLRFNGVRDSGGWHYTWYSQRVLPGWGLDIPGRHVGLAGMIMDGDGNVCVASSSLSKGTTLETPFGMAKVYDTGCPYGTIDVYTNW